MAAYLTIFLQQQFGTECTDEIVCIGYIVTSFPCRYRQKAGFAGPWEHADKSRLCRQHTPANEAADSTTWRRPKVARGMSMSMSIGVSRLHIRRSRDKTAYTLELHPAQGLEF